jgi:hypothetical protein
VGVGSGVGVGVGGGTGIPAFTLLVYFDVRLVVL